MRKLLKILGWLVVVVVVLVLVAISYFLIRYPRASDPPDVTVEATPALLTRGEYLFRSVSMCIVCHSVADESGEFAFVDQSTIGQGGTAYPLGGAGVVYAKNITPTGIGDWSDGEVIRAMRDGIDRKGGPLFPIMPYTMYRNLAEEDVYALVAYLRTLEPKPNTVPPRELHFPLSLIVRLMPSPGGWPPSATVPPDTANHVEYGRYLVQGAAVCAECHTPRDDRGGILPGMELAGGGGFPTGEWIAHPANLTPDSATGLGRWTREDFIRRFKSMEPYATTMKAAGPDQPRSPMPWPYFATMTEQDLGAIYDYLRTVPPVENRVVKYERYEEEAGE